MKDQQATKYISGLKYFIQKRVILHNEFSVDETHNKILKIERLQSITPLFKSLTPIEETTTEAPAAAPVMTTSPVAKGKENSCAKLGLASVIGVENLGTSPMNAQRESKST